MKCLVILSALYLLPQMLHCSQVSCIYLLLVRQIKLMFVHLQDNGYSKTFENIDSCRSGKLQSPVNIDRLESKCESRNYSQNPLKLSKAIPTQVYIHHNDRHPYQRKKLSRFKGQFTKSYLLQCNGASSFLVSQSYQADH